MTHKIKAGGFVGATVTPTKPSAKGSWSLTDMLIARKSNTWPIQVVYAPSTEITLLGYASSLTDTAVQTFSLLSGYSASIEVTMVGNATYAGSACCGNCGRSASGETVVARIVLDGNQTALTWQPTNANVNNSYGTATIVGGSKNGEYFRCGSFGNGCGYSPAAAPISRATDKSSGWVVQSYGAYAVGSGAYYNDDYYYGPCGASYGTGQDGFNNYGKSGGCSQGTPGAIYIRYLNDY